MRFTVHALIVSPHVLPLVDEIVRQCPNVDFTYVTTNWHGTAASDGAKKGWDSFGKSYRILNEVQDAEAAQEALENSDVLYSGFRQVDLFVRRSAKGLRTYYAPERWYKPILLFDFDLIPNFLRLRFRLPGIVRLLVPSYRRRAKGMIGLLKDPNFTFLAIGVHAVRDAVRTQKIFSGQWWSCFKVPKVKIELKPGGRVEGFLQLRLWVYSVNAGVRRVKEIPTTDPIKALWVGRMLYCKFAPTAVRAVLGDDGVRLTLLGMGDDLKKCRRIARGAANICFHEPEDLDGVRRLMREHDVLMLTSNDEEGWGAVASEGIEEGMRVIGTYEAGSCATMLPESNLFHYRDLTHLRQLLHSDLTVVPAACWSAEAAAKWLISDWSTCKSGRWS